MPRAKPLAPALTAASLLAAVALATTPAAGQDMEDVVTGIVGGIINETLFGRPNTPLGPLVPGNPGFPGNSGFPGNQGNQGWPGQPSYPNYPNGPGYQGNPFWQPAPPYPGGYVTGPPTQIVPVNPAAAAEPAINATQWLAIQQRLTALGHQPGPIDGIPGGRTREAVERFQAARGEAVTGYLTAAQQAALLAPPEPAGEAPTTTPGAPVPGKNPATPTLPGMEPDYYQALYAEFRAYDCALREEEIGEFITKRGGDQGEVQAFIADLERGGHLRPGAGETLVLSGLGGCGETAAAPAGWRADIQPNGQGSALVETAAGSFRLDCGNAGLFSPAIDVPVATPPQAVVEIRVDGRPVGSLPVACGNGGCAGGVIEDGGVIAALRGGGTVSIGGLSPEPVAFPLAGSNDAIATLACAHFY
ncbi:MAG: peptidoglycan-binding domain-containing protein [Azospirillaceae bacterium]